MMPGLRRRNPRGDAATRRAIRATLGEALADRAFTASARDLLGTIMSNSGSLSLAELDRRIAIVRDNIRQLIEQAAALSGAEDEARNADRIAQQNEELERLLKQRDALPKK